MKYEFASYNWVKEAKMNIFKQLRKERGLTQVELAKMVNVQQTTVSKWEVGRATPDYPVLLKLAEIYNVSVDYLLGREEITEEERAAGASATKKISITPIEDEMLYLFREVGKRHGEKGQRAMLDLAENLLKM